MRTNRLLIVSLVLSLLSQFGVPVHAGSAPSVQFNQWQNVQNGGEWANGSINSSNSAYGEGSSIPYRFEMAGLAQSPGEVIEFAITYAYQRTNHAFDFLTSYDASDSPIPFANSPLTSLTQGQCDFSALAIPDDVAHPFDNAFAASHGPQYFAICHDGTFLTVNSISDPVLITGSSQDDKEITIRFETDATEVAFFWGGHLALTHQWEPFDGTKGSAFVSGAPYHTSGGGYMDDNGNEQQDSGEQSFGSGDRSVQAGTIFLPGSITIVKDARPNSLQNFYFTSPEFGDFYLDDDGGVPGEDDILSNSVLFPGLEAGSYTFAETVPAGWSLAEIVCEGVEADTGDPLTPDYTVAGNAVTITLSLNQDVTCTFVDDGLPTITVLKTADPEEIAELGGSVDFTVRVTNDSEEAITLTSLDDDIHGDLDGQGSCAVTQTIPIDGFYECTFSATVTGNAGYSETDTVTAVAQDDEANEVEGEASATVTITDVPSAIQVTKTATPSGLNEPGGDVTYSFTVTNLSAVDTVTVTTLTDTLYGNLHSQGNCSVPQTLVPSGSYDCSFTTFVGGDPGDSHTNVVTASGVDDDGDPVSDDDDATVTIVDEPSSIKVTKAADDSSVPEPGADVEFTVLIDNMSAVDDVTIDSVVDDQFGDISASCDPALPATIAPGETITCTITEFIGGEPGDAHTNVVTASGTDDDGDPVSDDDNETVIITDLPSSIQVIKTPNPDSVPEPGDDVEFTIVVHNTSGVDDVTIDSVVDDQFGDIGASCVPALPATLAPAETITCTITEFIGGNAGDTHTDVVTASGTDDDGNAVSDDDIALVTISNVPSSIVVTKTAAPEMVTEPGDDVEFTVVVSNTSAVDDVTLDSVMDDQFGDVAASCSPSLPATLAPGETITCIFTEFIGGNEGEIHTDLVTASGTDDDGNYVSDDDPAVVTIEGLPSSIQVTKTASPDSIFEPGDDVQFTVVVSNTSQVDDVTIESVVDDQFGDVSAGCVPPLPETLGPGETLTCTFTEYVAGNADETHTDTVTAYGIDDDGYSVSDDDNAVVTILDVESAIEVIKTADPDSVNEPGGDVVYTFLVNNLSAVDSVTIDSLSDTLYGDLDGQGTCSVPQTIAAGDSYACSTTIFVSGNGDETHINVVTASGTDDDGNPVSDDDNAVVTVHNLPSEIEILKSANPDHVYEPGDDVSYSFTVNNLSAVDAVTITTLTDTLYGDLNGQGDCSVPQTIAVGGSYSCSFTTFVAGNSGDVHTNVVTASGADDDGEPVSDDDRAAVVVDDVPSAIEISKTADPTGVNEPGGDVSYTFVVSNVSAVDTVTVTTLTDTLYGDLNGQGDCSVPQTIPVGDSYTCSFTTYVSGNPGDMHTNVVTASGTDDDGNPVSDDDAEIVTITDEPSVVEILKVATPDHVYEPGGDVTYSFTMNNLSVVDTVTITTLIDTLYGDLNGQGDCSVPQTIPAGGSYTCSFTIHVSGEPGDTHANVVTASGVDDDGIAVEDDDSAVVTIDDLPSAIEVIKTADPVRVDEPGGDVTYSFVVNNLSEVDEVLIDSLVDSIHGDLNGQGDCSVPQTLPAGGSYSCTFTTFVGGNGGDVVSNMVTASGTDDDGNAVSDDDSATVLIDDLPSAIQVVKTANPTDLQEPGGDVTYGITVNNVSEVDEVTIDTLTDSLYGDLDGQEDCSLPQSIPAGGSYSCSFSTPVTGGGNEVVVNVVTASGTDDDGYPVSDDDNAVVVIHDVRSAIEVVKTATPIRVYEPGDLVTFAFTVTNHSTVDTVIIDTMTDTIYGDLDGDCPLPQTLSPAESYSCSLVAFVAGEAGEVQLNVVTASGTDDDGHIVSDEDSATVVIDQVPTPLVPDIEVTKTAEPDIAVPGQPITFTIHIANSGDLALDPVVLTDTLPPDFQYIAGSGSPSEPDVVAEPLLVWNNLGSLSPEESLTVSFQATAKKGAYYRADNVALAAGGSPSGWVSDDDRVRVDIVPPAVKVNKVLQGVDDPYAPNHLTFTIEIENTGISTIDVLPLEDRCSSWFLSLEQANPTPDELTEDGVIRWHDLTQPPPHGFGYDLEPGESVVVDVFFSVAHPITYTCNMAVVENALDVYGNPAPPVNDCEPVSTVPTAVELLYFTASRAESKIIVEWQTVWEQNSWGFNLYRSETPRFVDAQWMHAAYGPGWGQFDGQYYHHKDEDVVPGQVYYYWLEEMDLVGEVTRYGPVKAALLHRVYLPLVQR